MKIHQKKLFTIIIHGPTGVGKTDLSLGIASSINAEIINMDTGQFYTPLSIGTAKPLWKDSFVKHHFFDIIDSPGSITVAYYREILLAKIQEVISRGAIPIIVGGSSFYLYSLLFPVQKTLSRSSDNVIITDDNYTNWQQLNAIDPIRANAIKKTDSYRIARSLMLWNEKGEKPSSFVQRYDPLCDFLLLYVTRDLADLKNQIATRVIHMINNGWIDECQSLINTEWYDFLRHKKFIGYNEIFNYLQMNHKNKKDFDCMVQNIINKTNQYAKRQRTFWKKIEREVTCQADYSGEYIACIESINLTNADIRLYIKQLLHQLYR